MTKNYQNQEVAKAAAAVTRPLSGLSAKTIGNEVAVISVRIKER